MELKIDSGNCKKYPSHPAKREGDYKANHPQHRGRKRDAPPKHGEYPIKNLHSCRNGDNHRHDSKKGVHVRPCSHGEEMMEPNYK